MIKIFLVILLTSLSVNAAALTDTDCLLLTVYHEARGEPVAGQRAVVDVVQNRMRIKGKSACEIMKEKAQFSFYPHMIKKKPDLEMIVAYVDVLDMESVVTDNTTHFHATYVSPKWKKKLKRVARIGSHIFYEERNQTWETNSMLATK